MDLASVKHCRGVTELVLRWYLEPISGVLRLPGSSRSVFDVRVLQFQHDVDRVIDRTLNPSEQAFLLLVHGDGLNPNDVAMIVPLRLKTPCPATLALLHETFPDDSVTTAWLIQVALETRFGRALVASGLDRVSDYFTRGAA
jgi:hypothetical protein